MRRIIASFLVFLLLASQAHALPAFPGAQGMGASSTGGRNASATVYVVNTLSDDPDDGVTFREACEASGPRYVVFAVSGVIWLTSDLIITNPYLTIAGQTSPGGICIAGYTVMFGHGSDASPGAHGIHDVIVTHMRFRTGPLYETGDFDCVSVNGGSSIGQQYGTKTAGTDPSYNIIFDHCSFSWSNDEVFNSNLDVYDLTLSWCALVEPMRTAGHSEGDNHNYGPFFWGRYNSVAYGYTMHHCFLSSGEARCPEINYNGFLDATNNVSFDFYSKYAPHLGAENDGGTLKLPTANIIGCYHDVRSTNSSTSAHCALLSVEGSVSAYEAIYMSGCQQSSLGASTPAWYVGDYAQSYGAGLLSTDWQKSAPFATRDIAVTASAMNSTYAATVVSGAGANRIQHDTSLHPDSVDSAAQTRFTNGTAGWRYASSLDSTNDWPSFTNYTAPTDSDSDGMDDAWETSTFGNLSQTANGDYDSDGYSNIEEYLHYLGGYSEAGGDTTPPTISSATINTAGSQLTVASSEAVTVNDTANVPTLTMSGGAVTATYVSGSGTASLVYALSRTIESGETGHLDWDLGTDDVEDAAGNDLADVTDQTIYNYATDDVFTVCSSGCDYTTIEACLSGEDLTSGDNVIEVQADTLGGTKIISETSAWGLQFAGDSGTSGHPNILRGRAGDNIIIQGSGSCVWAISFNNSSYWTIENIEIRNDETTTAESGGVGAANSTTNAGITFSKCRFTQGSWAFYLYTNYDRSLDGLVVEDCYFADLLNGVAWMSDSDDPTFRRLYAKNCGSSTDHALFYADDDCGTMTVEDSVVDGYNASYAGGRAFKNSGTNSTLVVRQNTVKNSGGMAVGANADTWAYNNYFIGGAYSTRAVEVAYDANAYIYNNTIRGTYSGTLFYFGGSDGSGRVVDFRNNVASVTGCTYVFNMDPDVATLTSDYNVIYASPSTAWAYYDGATCNLASWQGHGYDASHSLFTDPHLGGMWPDSNSNVVNAGATIGTVTTDMLGVTRSSPDIGCIEYRSGSHGCGLSGVGVN